ncbi:hypothetical protein [Paraburkholderia sp. J7]|nr:hypothetical protein [Paraburkholderia sp. J7]
MSDKEREKGTLFALFGGRWIAKRLQILAYRWRKAVNLWRPCNG